MNDIFLSIAIPTFNRKQNLLNLIDSLKNQILTDDIKDVEIIVSDNCSTDTTEKELKNWITKNSEININYIRNSSNLGFDVNIYKAIKATKGEFVWTLGDDDELNVKALSLVLNAIKSNNKKNDLVFCFINYYLEIGGKKLSPEVNFKNNFVIDGENLFIKTNFASSFVSSNIFKRSVWLENDFNQYFGTLWYHFFVQRDILVGKKALIISNPLICQKQPDLQTSRNEKSNNDNDVLEFYINAHINFLKFAFSLEEYNYSSNIIRLAKSFAWIETFRQVIYYKITVKSYLIHEIFIIIKELSRFFSLKPLFWVLILPLLMMPSSFIIFLYKLTLPLYHYIKKKITTN